MVIDEQREQEIEDNYLQSGPMTFQQVLENEVKHPGMYYEHTNLVFSYLIQFDPLLFGRLVQISKDGQRHGRIDLYAKDLIQGHWRCLGPTFTPEDCWTK